MTNTTTQRHVCTKIRSINEVIHLSNRAWQSRNATRGRAGKRPLLLTLPSTQALDDSLLKLSLSREAHRPSSQATRRPATAPASASEHHCQPPVDYDGGRDSWSEEGEAEDGMYYSSDGGESDRGGRRKGLCIQQVRGRIELFAKLACPL